MKTYLVGGAVRDRLLGLGQKDRDWVVVGATVQEMLDKNYLQVGKDFPVFLHPESKEEYALARTERKTGPGHTGFEISADSSVTLEEDLRRRDLTINAIAEDTEGNLVDPFNGHQDVRDRILRHVSPAFSEDPLRVLRVARFAARYAHLDFRIAPETLQLMASIVQAGELEHLVVERIWQEMVKALQEHSPVVFFRTLRDCGALAVVLPEVDALFGVPQPPEPHPEIDTGVHVLMSLEQATRLSDDPVVRFAALVHDIGKGATPESEWPDHAGHEQRGDKMLATVAKRMKLPREYYTLASLASSYHTICHQLIQAPPETLLKLLENLDAFRRPLHMDRFLLACEADARGRTGLEDREYPQPQRLRRSLRAAERVDIPALLDRNPDKKNIKQLIRGERLQAIADEFGEQPS